MVPTPPHAFPMQLKAKTHAGLFLKGMAVVLCEIRPIVMCKLRMSHFILRMSHFIFWTLLSDSWTWLYLKPICTQDPKYS